MEIKERINNLKKQEIFITNKFNEYKNTKKNIKKEVNQKKKKKKIEKI